MVQGNKGAGTSHLGGPHEYMQLEYGMILHID